MSDLLEKIHSRGYWQVVIRPSTFVEKRIRDLTHLLPIVERCSVRFRAWDYPHIDTSTPPLTGMDWVGQEYDRDRHREVWRLYQSGQFVHVFAMVEDWLDQSLAERFEPGKKLALGSALLKFTEIFEFAGRLAVTEAAANTTHVEITVHGLRGRCLLNDAPRGFPLDGDPAHFDTFPYVRDFPSADLISNPKVLAREPASELFRMFGEEMSQDVLTALQERRLLAWSK